MEDSDYNEQFGDHKNPKSGLGCASAKIGFQRQEVWATYPFKHRC